MTAPWIDRKPRRSAEEQLQRAIIDHLRLRADPKVIWMHIPNGGARSKSEGGRLKAMGTLAGAPDLMFVMPDATVCFMELKRQALAKGDHAGVLSEAQIAFHKRCEEIGVPIVTAYNIDQALAVLEGWGVIA